MKKPNYAAMFTLRPDGRYQGFWHDLDKNGQPIKSKRHTICDRNPERLYKRIIEKESNIPKPITFDAAADAWEAKHWDRIGAKTAETYKAPLQRVRDQFSGLDAEEVTAQAVQAFLAELGRKGFSRRSVQMHRDILNMIFNNAILECNLRFNPCVAVTMPRNLPKKKRELPDDKAIEAVKASVDHPFGLFALICLYAGLRRGEALALQYEDIDRVRNVIHITKAVEFIGNNPHIKRPKTDAGVRIIPLLEPVAKVLPEKKHGLIFPDANGNLLPQSQFKRRWKKYCNDIGVEITPHQLRHGYATILYEAGIQDKDAQELLGHSSIAVTRDVYTHIRSTRREETASKLNEYVKKK